MTISDERIERAFRAGRVARLKLSSLTKPDDEYEMNEGEREFMRAALEADEPEITASELRCRIEGLTTAKTIAEAQQASDIDWAIKYPDESVRVDERILCARIIASVIDRRLASLQPEVAAGETAAACEDFEIGEFKPCRVDADDSNMTMWFWEDTSYVAQPAFLGVYHFIDELVAMDDGRVVGVQFWGPPPAPNPEVAAKREEGE